LKIYQVKYQHYGTTKYCYTVDFEIYYNTYVEAKEGSSGYKQPESFQEKMHEMLKKQGLV